MPTFIPDRALIAVSGKDALSLLQRLVTADLAPLLAGDGAAYTLLLTPQGKCRFDFFVIRDSNRLYLDASAAQAGGLIAALDKYRLRAEAMFTIIPDCAVQLESGLHAGILSFRDPRHGALGWRNWARAAAPAAADAYEAVRIRLGIVEPSRDLPDASAPPLEYGLDKLGAISFKKGCYLGQEPTARMHNRDLARHEVCVVAAADAVAGTILAAADGLALVQVRRAGK